MTIETQFNIDQQVWFLENNEVEQGVTKKLFYDPTECEDGSCLTYTVEIEGGIINIHETRLFSSKQDLLDSL